MKRGIQGVTRRKQPKPPITESVAGHIIKEYLRFFQKYGSSEKYAGESGLDIRPWTCRSQLAGESGVREDRVRQQAGSYSQSHGILIPAIACQETNHQII
jgi:hypothetical protein